MNGIIEVYLVGCVFFLPFAYVGTHDNYYSIYERKKFFFEFVCWGCLPVICITGALIFGFGISFLLDMVF